MSLEYYVEERLISKRSCMAVLIILIFAFTVLTSNDEGMTVMAGIVGTVVGFYFGTKSQPDKIEVVQG